MTMNTDDFAIDVTEEHIRQSNLIEGVRGQREVDQSMMAWRFLRDAPKLDVEVLLTLHNIIMLNLLPRERGGAGDFRIHNVAVGGRVCPHFNQVEALVDEWLEQMGYWQDKDPKIMHIKFEHIHPFIDGNGRTGRMLMWWHEIRSGLKPTLITYKDRWLYYAWF